MGTSKNSDGCVSALSNIATINAQPETPSAPTVGTITQPTCAVATGSVVLNGLPSSGIWTLTRTPGGTTTGTGTSATLSGLASGTYYFTVSNGTCTSTTSANVVINAYTAISVTASAGIIATYGGTTSLTATATGGTPPLTYSLNSGTYTSTNIFTVAAGTYTVTVKDANGCTKNSNTVVVNQPQGNVSTTLSYNGASSAQYGSTVTLSARLRHNSSEIRGKSITFMIGSLTATAITNSSGVASTAMFINLVPGNYQVIATFAGDATYGSSSDSHSFTVTRKPLTIALTGTVSKVYDGNNVATPTQANFTLNGKISGDDVIANYISATYNNSSVGTKKRVTVTGMTLAGAKANCYNLSNTSINANIGTITAAPAGLIVGSTPKSAEIVSDIPTINVISAKAYPNPFTDRVAIEFSATNDCTALLEIYNISGIKLGTLFNAPIEGGVIYKVDYIPNLVSSQVVLYQLTIDGKTQVGKLIYQERR